jgi:hypothetical protein
MLEEPGLRSVYAPAYHALGALLAQAFGLAGAARLLALAGAAALIAGFRAFQRAAGLPAESAALFCFSPYAFALSWCLPKIEAGGYGLAFAGFALLLRGRHAWAAVALAATFFVHTGAALFFGLIGGVLAAAQRDPRALASLAVGSLLAAPLPWAHLADGCSPAEALLFSRGDYLRSVSGWSSLDMWPRIVALAGPVPVVCAALGAPRLLREHRAAALAAGAVLLLYLNELWLAPFGARSTLNLLRGLTILAFPVSAAAGVFAALYPRRAALLVAACAALALATTALAVPGSCHRVPVDLERVAALEVDRCSFRWHVRSPR